MTKNKAYVGALQVSDSVLILYMTHMLDTSE
jgi:hypothetical protein